MLTSVTPSPGIKSAAILEIFPEITLSSPTSALDDRCYKASIAYY